MALFTPKGLLFNLGALASVLAPLWIQQNTTVVHQIPSIGWVLLGIPILVLGLLVLYYLVHSTAFISVDTQAGRININEGWQPSRLRDELVGIEFADLESVNVNRDWFSGFASGFAAWIEQRGVNPVLVRVLSTGTIKFVAKGKEYSFPDALDPQNLKRQVESMKKHFMDQKTKEAELREAEANADLMTNAFLEALRIRDEERRTHVE